MRHPIRNKHKEEGLIFGIHPVLEALRAGKEIDKVLIQSGAATLQLSELKRQLTELDIPMSYVPKEKLMQYSRINHQGLVAFLSPVDFSPLEEVLQQVYERGDDPFLLILDRVTDVRNFGAICRTAECVGVHAVIVPTRGSARIGGDAVKTSAGALMHIPVCRSMNLKDTLQYLKDSGIRLVAASEKGKTQLFQTDLAGPVGIIMGSEETGISPEYLKKCDEVLSIPMLGETSSLNVSVAAGVMLYEVLRQRLDL
jgi:23S rRNA (guanosine2251-2'-O)-methyltransferase